MGCRAHNPSLPLPHYGGCLTPPPCPRLPRQPIIRRSAEWRDLKADLTWWATQRAEVVVAFVRGMHEALACGVRGGWRRGQDTAWRRSAVAFLQDLGLLVGAHASVVHRVAAEAAALDRAIAASGERAGQGGGHCLLAALLRRTCCSARSLHGALLSAMQSATSRVEAQPPPTASPPRTGGLPALEPGAKPAEHQPANTYCP